MIAKKTAHLLRNMKKKIINYRQEQLSWNLTVLQTSNHFDSKHKNLTPLERREYINNVKVIPRREVNWPVLRVTKGQKTLEQFIKPPTPVTSEEEDVPIQTGVGMRSFPSHPLSETSFVSFQKFLTNVAGNLRNEKVAREIAMDVSKYIKFACGSNPIPNWER